MSQRAVMGVHFARLFGYALSCHNRSLWNPISSAPGWQIKPWLRKISISKPTNWGWWWWLEGCVHLLAYCFFFFFFSISEQHCVIFELIRPLLIFFGGKTINKRRRKGWKKKKQPWTGVTAFSVWGKEDTERSGFTMIRGSKSINCVDLNLMKR